MASYQMVKLMPESEWNKDGGVRPTRMFRSHHEDEKSEELFQTALNDLMMTDHRNASKSERGPPPGADTKYGKRRRMFTEPVKPSGTPEMEHSAVDSMDLGSYTPVRCHREDPLLDACLSAYYHHQPIVFSPDLVYGYLAKGVASHVNKFPEQLRKLYVNHEGKKKLEYENDSFVRGKKDNDWGLMFQNFADQLKTQTKGNSVVQNDLKFTTSTKMTEAHRNVLAMESMKSYFEYVLRCGCGTACVILEGTAEDWELLQKTVTDQLAEINSFCEKNIEAKSAALSWWSPMVEVLLKNFVDTYDSQEKGEELTDVLRLWWGAMFKYSAGAASHGKPEFITGWINALFPYLADEEQNPWLLHWSPIAKDEKDMYKRLKSARDDRKTTTNRWGGKWQDRHPDEIIIHPRKYKSYSASVPFIWKYWNEKFDMRAVIGYCMLGQVAVDGAEYPKGTLKLFPAWVVYHDNKTANPAKSDAWLMP